ncbi:MAG: acyl carrier protein [Burkholderiales bacterium]|nr:acyl carrier protein [Burkholderiales bacterium]
MIKITNSVKWLIAGELQIDVRDVLLDRRLVDDLESDSLNFVGMIIEIERRFGIRIDDDDAANVVTVRDLVALVKRGVAARDKRMVA